MATETWVLNETPSDYSAVVFPVQFTCNGISYSKLERESSYAKLYYDTTLVYDLDDHTGWVNEAYRTITFSIAPTGGLLTWLQANGTKQASTPKVTVDLTSLSGYESLAAGTYQLGVKAKASGYQDSDLSATVSFTKLAAPVATAADTSVNWEAVANAESYDVYVDGELYENTTGGGNG